jgi:hypothetical protein
MCLMSKDVALGLGQNGGGARRVWEHVIILRETCDRTVMTRLKAVPVPSLSIFRLERKRNSYPVCSFRK